MSDYSTTAQVLHGNSLALNLLAGLLKKANKATST